MFHGWVVTWEKPPVVIIQVNSPFSVAPDVLPTEGIFAELRHGSDGIHLDLDLGCELCVALRLVELIKLFTASWVFDVHIFITIYVYQ